MYPLSRSLALAAVAILAPVAVQGQSSSGTLSGTVKDATGAVVANASVSIANGVTGYRRTVVSDGAGHYTFFNIPFNGYQLTATAPGLQSASTLVQVQTAIAVVQAVTVAPVTDTTIDVETTADLPETDPNYHTDVDRTMIARLPVGTSSSELSAIVTQLSPGVAADSNGLLHGMGDHNEVSFSVDGQPITDQQSKVFSNQLPADAVQSLQVIEGAPPAEFGDKTSLVIVATTRSGQGVKKPTGLVTVSYGGFGTSKVLADVAYGGDKWGNFLSASAQQSGRFLDTPEFRVYNDKGNEENFFDRVDRQFTNVSSMHLNLQYTRSLFQTPNSYDTQFGYATQGLTVAHTDQRSKIETFLVAPTYTRTLGATAVFTFAPYVRRDTYRYIPSANLLDDFGPIQQESVGQQRSLTNAGLHSDVTLQHGIHNAKIGGQYQQTFIRENDTLGLVDPGLNDPASATFNPVLRPYDLTRGGTTYTFHGQADVKQLALYAQDSITAGAWQFNFGVRGDFYNGLVVDRQAEPRAALSYNSKRTGTVLRVSYARTQETPFNENLVLSQNGCLDPVLNGIFSTIGPCTAAPFRPGFRNEFHAGFSQGVGKHFLVNAEYITKYTHNGYDFSVLGATPITFPIEWHNSKIPGYAATLQLTDLHGVTVRTTMSSVAARFYNPQIGGVGATIGTPGGLPFRIDHDERFNQTTHLEYKLPFHPRSAYYSFNWKYDSGLVAGSVPCYNVVGANTSCVGGSIAINGQPAINLRGLTADEQFQAGLVCNGVAATYTSGFTDCLASQLTSKLVTIPAPNTEDDDRNPQRIQPRNLFDMELGDDDLIALGHTDHYHLGARITAVNIANKYALYNFLSTFSGTHYVNPRTVTAEVAFHF